MHFITWYRFTSAFKIHFYTIHRIFSRMNNVKKNISNRNCKKIFFFHTNNPNCVEMGRKMFFRSACGEVQYARAVLNDGVSSVCCLHDEPREREKTP